ncbi:hypothetical protein GKA01_07060 [Gluconobacter kanchanaburiensis NBRC 103587]|uniref:Uncharacterized protein n=1 Tax=Gluconobacter kanchanaburiensis NBRC 103587 TaxID=1307948 RepID=A0A511B4Z9_9PROT|nr:hypothetical protein AA103587_0428 [Gluconobacter kanchanaburiensis NBRC 103587]GEK95509.1 hypothetical protein GKA01_07060 [Gluconobacter kanchanaburiensis NBRC 103587]
MDSSGVAPSGLAQAASGATPAIIAVDAHKKAANRVNLETSRIFYDTIPELRTTHGTRGNRSLSGVRHDWNVYNAPATQKASQIQKQTPRIFHKLLDPD